MKTYLDDDFLLDGLWAQDLYHSFSEPLPIYDYHCHLNAGDIVADRKYNNLAEIWLEGDHYKWRAMRTCGVDEKDITGKSPWQEKFRHWAATVPTTLRNPLYDWTHLELLRYFGIDERLSEKTWESIYHRTSEMLATDEFSARSLMKKMNVTHVCTTNDPTESLEDHRELATEGFSTRVLPTFRPDRFIDLNNRDSFLIALDDLCEVEGHEIRTYDDLLDGLKNRHDHFHHLGCRLADHGVTYMPQRSKGFKAEKTFKEALRGKPLSKEQIDSFMADSLFELGRLNSNRQWAQQFHMGVFRNINTSRFAKLGPDTGFDSIGDDSQARGLIDLLDRLESSQVLGKTILYNINPSDNALLGTIIGAFQRETPGKIQWGAAWWFLDQKRHMKDQIDTLSSVGLLWHFVGMLTDSRSFLSYPRHEYFRRILCNTIGGEVDRGELPADRDLLGRMIKGISYDNASAYFDLD